MTPNTRTIVVDVDDTISTHVDRDYANAVPHRDVIDRVNKMYDQGWHVIYHTARGQWSCQGDVELIERSRGPILRDWMTKHGVKYHELVFGKPLAVFYVDDKAMRPDELVSMRYEVLKGGSGASIELIGDRVVKRASGVEEQWAWYRAARDVCKTPDVHSCFGDTLTIEYVEGHPLNEVAQLDDVYVLRDLVTKGFGSMRRMTLPDWSTMVDRVDRHMAQNAVPNETEIRALLRDPKTVSFMNENASFCHGDLTFENVIKRGNDLVLIDPNAPRGLYSSYVLDLGKMYQSLHYSYEHRLRGSARDYHPTLYLALVSSLSEQQHYHALLMELVHYVRMLKYKSPAQRTIVRDVIASIYMDIKRVS